jgi:hypothetical protein
MPAKKKATAKTTDTADTPSTGGSRSTARTGDGEQQVAVDDGSGPEPSEVNSSLDSDRMKALLEDHRAMGARPG